MTNDYVPEQTEKTGAPHREAALVLRVVVCVLILAGGVGGMLLFGMLKRPPSEATPEELPLHVEVVTANPKDTPVTITTYGQVAALDTVQVVPQVAGNVLSVHPNLEVGKVVPEGEVLFEIDPSTYAAALAQAQGQAAQLRGTIKRLERRMALDKKRLESLERTEALAKKEFERRKKLFENDQVGSKSVVEQVEQAYIQAKDAVDQMRIAIDLYPIQIQEAKSSLDAALGMQRTAEINLKRTKVLAPFNARVKMHSVEVGQYVAPGAPVAMLANDEILEIAAPVDSRDARRWLRFNGEQQVDGSAWFSALEPVRCEIRWTEDEEGHVWEGRLDRVEQFNQATRMLTVAVQIPAENALSKDDGELPLVEGMFCSVSIPGTTMRGVTKLPHWAVSFENTVFRANEQPARPKQADTEAEQETGAVEAATEAKPAGTEYRLETVPVEMVYEEGDYKYVRGLNAGDLIVTTRLVAPLENSLLEVTETELPGTEESSS